MKIEYGTGRRCINPPMAISLAGYFNARMWDKVLDDLEARAVVFKQGSTYAGIIHLDLATVPLYVYEMILDEVRKAGVTVLGRKNLTICAIHTHTGPEIRRDKPGFNPDYLPFLAKLAAEALREALDDLREGEVVRGMTSDNRFLFNRRYWMKNGRVMTNPGKLNPEIVRPEGEIDPEIPLFGIERDGKLELLLCNIVNHTDTIGGTGVSADWNGFLRRQVERALGPGSMVCPITGASGNINHFDVSSDRNQTCYAEAERIGSGYTETILKALPTLRPVPDGALKTVFGEATVMPREISAEEVSEARAVVEKYADEKFDGIADMTSEDLAKGVPAVLKYFAEMLLKQADYREEVHLYLTGIAFGDSVVIASLPSEPFVEIGLALRKEIFSDRLCLVAALANGLGSDNISGGYIPNPWNYGRGGYEDTPRSNPFSKKTSSVVLEKWRELAKRF